MMERSCFRAFLPSHHLILKIMHLPTGRSSSFFTSAVFFKTKTHGIFPEALPAQVYSIAAYVAANPTAPDASLQAYAAASFFRGIMLDEFLHLHRLGRYLPEFLFIVAV